MPSGNEKLCFVLMPFKDELGGVYRNAIKPACEAAGFQSLSVDELKGAFNINRKIIKHIFSSHAIIADLTEWNPNVFYEMGVAHALDNKTIMIIQKQDKLPFDVSSYRCIIYEQTDAGLLKLHKEIADSLQCLDEWRRQPSNPVQDFKPDGAFISIREWERREQEWRRKIEEIQGASALKAALEKLQHDLRVKEQLLSDVISQTKLDREALRKMLQDQKISTGAMLQNLFEHLRSPLSTTPQLSKTKSAESLQLRSQPLNELAEEQVKKMLHEKNFFESDHNKNGRGLPHEYETKEQNGEKLIIDYLTGLTWQLSGSSKHMAHAEAEKYIRALNNNRFAGYDNWRLPTLEESMSLMEPKKHGASYIDPTFDHKQEWIWPADFHHASSAWVVHFGNGNCSHRPVGIIGRGYVRAVR